MTHSPRSKAYKQLWRIVDGAVFDALWTHPDYLTEKGRRNAQTSIVKRVTGAVLGYAEEAQGRSGESPAAGKEDGETATLPSRMATPCDAMSKWWTVCGSAVHRFLRRSPS